ncbi:MAG: SurA N-terminal domain-containing protein [Rhodospirillales bacterium]|nr:SurA N-terminal domain-containing protein [Rhodospirillales bacterium]
MLEAIRKRTGSILIKLLFFLLILSFAAWGVGDMINQAVAPDAVATVGEEKIQPQSLQSEYSRELVRLRGQLGQTFDSEQAKAFGIMDAVLNRMVVTKLYDTASKDLGILVSDKAVLSEIKSNPNFQGITKEFDRNQLNQVLMNNGLNEQEYLGIVQGDLLRRPLITGVDGGSTVPKALFAPLYAFEKETRTAAMILVATEEMDEPANPGEETLQKYHKDTPAPFTAPEYRSVSVVNVAIEALAEKEEVSPEEIAETYEAHKEDYQSPQTREIQQIVYSDLAQAKAAHQRLTNGDDFIRVAKETAGLDENSLSLGMMGYDELPKEIADPAFGIPQGGFSTPVESPLGWHIIRVAKVVREKVQELAKVSDAIKNELAKEKALETQFKLFNKIEDELAGGSTLEELTRNLGMPLEKFAAVDSRGLDPQGVLVQGLPKGQTINQTIFATEQGTNSGVKENGDDGFFIVRVDGVTPPVLRPYDQVKPQVLDAWILETKGNAAKEKAEKLVERIKGGETLEAVAKDVNIPVEVPTPFMRTGGTGATGVQLPAQLVEEVFKARKGQPVLAPSPDGYLVATVSKIEAPTDGLSSEEGKKSMDALRNTMSNDLMAQLAASLRNDYDVRINRTAVQQLY